MPPKYTKAQKQAYARRMRKRKRRIAPKKKAYQQSYQIAKITAPLLPKTRLCFMTYLQKFTLDPAPINAGLTDLHNSTMPIRTITLNNLKDMDEETSSLGTPGNMNDLFSNHQPRGYTEWGAHYNHMTVLSTKTEIEGRNRYTKVDNAGNGTYILPPEPVALGYLSSHFNTKQHSDVAGTKFNDIQEQRQLIYRELNDEKHRVKLKHTWTLKKEPVRNKNLKMDNVTSDYNWGSLYEVDILQTNKRFLHVFAYPLGLENNVDPTPIDVVVRVSACVLLSSRNEVSRS